MRCQKQARFKYVDRLPEPRNAAASFGTIIHQAMEKITNGEKAADVIEWFKQTWDNPPDHLVPQVWPKRTSAQGYRKMGIECLQRYADNLDWNKKQVLGTEVAFLVPIGRHWLHGFIDDVSIMGGRKGKVLAVVDYKTNGKQPYPSQLRMNQQFSVYSFAANHEDFWTGQPQEVIDKVFPDYAPEDRPKIPGIENGAYWREMTKDLPIALYWHHVRNGNVLDCGPRDMQDYQRLLEAIDAIEAAVTADAYVPNISGESCGQCAFAKQCGAPNVDLLNYSPILED